MSQSTRYNAYNQAHACAPRGTQLHTHTHKHTRTHTGHIKLRKQHSQRKPRAEHTEGQACETGGEPPVRLGRQKKARKHHTDAKRDVGAADGQHLEMPDQEQAQAKEVLGALPHASMLAYTPQVQAALQRGKAQVRA